MTFWDFLSDPLSAFLVVTTLIVCVPAVGMLVVFWLRTKEELRLKRTMIERGMSAEEIERVLAAGVRGKADEFRELFRL